MPSSRVVARKARNLVITTSLSVEQSKLKSKYTKTIPIATSSTLEPNIKTSLLNTAQHSTDLALSVRKAIQAHSHSRAATFSAIVVLFSFHKRSTEWRHQVTAIPLYTRSPY